jgi:sodium-dependent dicarboxylate transporter 2/3/5
MVRADSRRAALKYLGDIVNPQTKFGFFVLVTAIAGLVSYLFTPSEFSLEQAMVFFLLTHAIGLWLSEAIPPFAVGIYIIAYLVFVFGTDVFFLTDYDVNHYVSTWTNGVIWLLLGGFFLAESLAKVGLDVSLFRLTVKRFGTEPRRLLLGLMLTTAIGSMVMSNTATTAMMLSSLTPLMMNMGKKSPFVKALLVGIPASASVGGLGTIIGSTPNAIAVGALEKHGIIIDFVTWMGFGVPIALTLVVILWYILINRFIPKVKTLDLAFMEKQGKSDVPASRKQIVLGILGFTILLWLTTPIHKLPLAGSSAFPILTLTMTGIITSDDVRGLAWDTLMLVAGGLALGAAMVDFNIADYFVEVLKSGQLPPWVLLLILAFVSMLLSNIMSNTATSSVLIPLGIALPGSLELSAPLVIAISASCALFLPVSTPPNAIAYSTGYISQKDFRLGGIAMGIIGPIIAVFAMILFSWIY